MEDALWMLIVVIAFIYIFSLLPIAHFHADCRYIASHHGHFQSSYDTSPLSVASDALHFSLLSSLSESQEIMMMRRLMGFIVMPLYSRFFPFTLQQVLIRGVELSDNRYCVFIYQDIYNAFAFAAVFSSLRRNQDFYRLSFGYYYICSSLLSSWTSRDTPYYYTIPTAHYWFQHVFMIFNVSLHWIWYALTIIEIASRFLSAIFTFFADNARVSSSSYISSDRHISYCSHIYAISMRCFIVMALEASLRFQFIIFAREFYHFRFSEAGA